ncbi:MAG TPA: hypothetical protein VG937_14970 [Polyangiaceae bacterium]|jgi:hypothetical protein|nr:hypothetical protein [Polyangiaceae bacterium]
MPRAIDEPAPASLPPLDRGDDSDELPDDLLGGLLDALPELTEDPEDSLEATLDYELDLDDSDAGDPGDAAEDLDVGRDSDDLMPVAPETALDDDDSDGLPGLEATLDEPNLQSVAIDEGDGMDDLEAPTLLPALDRGDDAEGVGEIDELPQVAAFGDEPRPPDSTLSWRELGPGLALEACGALATADGIVVAASSDLFWFAAGELSHVRLEAGSSRIYAVALVGSGWEYAVCSTTNGKLFRRGRLASASGELRRIREAAENLPSAREVFDLCQPGPVFPHALMLRTASGKLLRSDDDGISFRRVTERRVIALAPRGMPAVAVSEDGALLLSEDGGGSFSEVALDELAQKASSSGSPLVAAHGDAIVLSDTELGVLVSVDRGRSFRRVPGTREVTAICVGTEPSGTVAFAATYDETRNQSFLLRVVVSEARAETVARFEGTASDEDGSENGRTAAIVWDDVHQRLWAAGAFGVKVFARAD